MDSGSVRNVMNPEAVPGYTPRPSAGSRNGIHFVAADGQVIENLGEADIQLQTEEGLDIESNFQFANVTRPLYGTGTTCDNDATVIFTASQCRVLKGPVQIVGGREISRFHRKPGGLYNAKMKVRRPKTMANDSGSPGFTRQGAK